MESAVLKNLDIYQSIAEDALERSEKALREHRRDKPDGQPGSIITFDPNRVSFKQSLIALVFSGVYLDALLRIIGSQRLGHKEYKRIDRNTTYEYKLRKLGIRDEQALEEVAHYRKTRNDVVHERVYDSDNAEKVQFAQDEARHAVALIHKVTQLLDVCDG